MCVDVIVEPLGLRMMIGCRATCLFWMGRSTVRKVSVLPVSAMAKQCEEGTRVLNKRIVRGITIHRLGLPDLSGKITIVVAHIE